METDKYVLDRLGRDEYIVWTGKPKSGRVFEHRDIIQIPLSLLFFGFSLFMLSKSLNLQIDIFHIKAAENYQPNLFFIIFGVVFSLVGFQMSIGRFFLRSYLFRHMRYYITNKRIFSFSNGFIKEKDKDLIEVKKNISTNIQLLKIGGGPMIHYERKLYSIESCWAERNICGSLDVIFHINLNTLVSVIYFYGVENAVLIADVITELSEKAKNKVTCEDIDGTTHIL
ncbi:MAG: hypothetical protein JXN65_05470 [Clostridia bacterium]|nr:hypothetical protein [Clostridia bacterium]